MSRTQTIILCLFLTLASILATHFGSYPAINDRHDVWIYFQRGSWVTSGQEPYRDVFSEYPQIATWLFAVPHLVSDAWTEAGESKKSLEQAYRFVFSAMMALFLAATIALVYHLRPDRKWLALLLLLPASLYFTQNRFDIVPALLTLASLAALRSNRFYSAFILLGIATMTKWYALVMVPVFMIYIYQTQRQKLMSLTISYGLVIIAIILPTFLAIGWEGFLIPYKFHLTRTGNSESFYHLLMVSITHAGLPNALIEPIFLKLFLVLQFAAIPLCAMARIDSWEKVLKWSALTILCFIFFAKFYSPQWLLWITPMLVLLARTKTEIAAIVLFDLLTYFYFPYIYYLQDKHELLFPALIALKTLFFAGWIVYFLKNDFSRLILKTTQIFTTKLQRR